MRPPRARKGADLTPDERTAYELRQQGLSYARMEAKLGVPLSTIAGRIHRARIKLGVEPDRITHCGKCDGRHPTNTCPGVPC
jgi:DNA-directed RNA polymerase specialized sigma24 family protein